MQENKKKILKRLKSARGHFDRVIKMYEEGNYCIDVLQQSLAVQAAIKRADEEILSDHLKSCVQNVLDKKEKDNQIAEIMEVFKKGRK